MTIRIDVSKNFRALKKSERKAILEGKNDRRYSIKFKRAGIKSSRTTKYYGVLTGIPMLQKFVPAKQFMANIDCPSCRGRKFSPAHDEHKLCHLSIGEFMCSTFWSLEEWIQSISSHTSESSLNFAVNQISMFVRNAVELDLGHLSFHRSIPTLSGGELQRLRLVQVFNTQLSDLLIILDEPLSGLSGEDKKAIFDNIVKLSEHHTMLIVDHNKTFIKKARTVTALGEKGGRHGGNIVDASKFIASQHLDQKYETPKPTEVNRIFLNAPIYGFSGAELEIGKCALNIIYGKSGVGKSTLLREYLPQYFTNYQYVQQKALVGKKDSSVATALNILDVIVGEFAKENGKDKKFFSKMSGGEGACRACSGKGFIGYGNDYRLRALIECRDCRGTGYSHKLNRYCIRGRNLRQAPYTLVQY